MDEFLKYLQDEIDKIDNELKSIDKKYPTSGKLDDDCKNGVISRWEYDNICMRIDRLVINRRRR